MSAQAPTAQNTEEASWSAGWSIMNLQHIAARKSCRPPRIFGHRSGSLGLDSIDALEIALAIQNTTASNCSRRPQTRPDSARCVPHRLRTAQRGQR